MTRSKVFVLPAVILFVFGVTTMGSAVAGEKQKIKAHGATYTTEFEPFEVGDDKGHIIGLYKQKGILFNEITGTRSVDQGMGIMDINPKTGGFIRGYGITIDKDGDKMIRSYEGRPVAKGQSEGNWSYIKGTGKYEGIKGGGTWSSYMLAPRQSYWEAEGEMEMPSQ
jgi:hypothetical protein